MAALVARLQRVERMYRACIVVADASRARLFTYERTSSATGAVEKLIEARDLVSLAPRTSTVDLLGDWLPAAGPLPGGLDDHGIAHVGQLDAEFARTIIHQLIELLRETRAQRLTLCASPKMLAELHSARPALQRVGLVIDEIARNLVKLTPAQLRDRLAEYGFLPARVAHATL